MAPIPGAKTILALLLAAKCAFLSGCAGTQSRTATDPTAPGANNPDAAAQTDQAPREVSIGLNGDMIRGGVHEYVMEPAREGSKFIARYTIGPFIDMLAAGAGWLDDAIDKAAGAQASLPARDASLVHRPVDLGDDRWLINTYVDQASTTVTYAQLSRHPDGTVNQAFCTLYEEGPCLTMAIVYPVEGTNQGRVLFTQFLNDMQVNTRVFPDYDSSKDITRQKGSFALSSQDQAVLAYFTGIMPEMRAKIYSYLGFLPGRPAAGAATFPGSSAVPSASGVMPR